MAEQDLEYRSQDAQLRDGAWQAGTRHTATQARVDIVDVDVNL